MESWVVWVLGAILLFILEVFVPGFFLACLGVGCLFTGLTAFFRVGVTVQLSIFAIVTLLSLFGIRPFFLKCIYKDKEENWTNTEALIGKTGVVTEEIDPVSRQGRVKVGGEDWKGVSIDGQPLAPGVQVTVERIEGNKVLVRSIAKKKEEN